MGDTPLEIAVSYLSAGANRQTGVADWNQDGTLAFGADSNICLWRPTVTTTGTFYMNFATDQRTNLGIGLRRQGSYRSAGWSLRHCQGCQILELQSSRWDLLSSLRLGRQESQTLDFGLKKWRVFMRSDRSGTHRSHQLHSDFTSNS